MNRVSTEYQMKYDQPCLVWTGLLFALIVFFSSFGILAADPGNYLGSQLCSSCHEEVAADWQQSRHARSFESLRKSGQENLPGCVRCHVTGYEQSGGYIDQELTPDHKGVQCEECHGPGKQHIADPDRDTIDSIPGIDTCRRCHTPGQDPDFDYVKKVAAGHSGFAVAAKRQVAAWLIAIPDQVDFGTIDEGKPATTTVTIQNTADTNIVITDLRTN